MEIFLPHKLKLNDKRIVQRRKLFFYNKKNHSICLFQKLYYLEQVEEYGTSQGSSDIPPMGMLIFGLAFLGFFGHVIYCLIYSGYWKLLYSGGFLSLSFLWLCIQCIRGHLWYVKGISTHEGLTEICKNKSFTDTLKIYVDIRFEKQIDDMIKDVKERQNE